MQEVPTTVSAALAGGACNKKQWVCAGTGGQGVQGDTALLADRHDSTRHLTRVRTVNVGDHLGSETMKGSVDWGSQQGQRVVGVGTCKPVGGKDGRW